MQRKEGREDSWQAPFQLWRNLLTKEGRMRIPEEQAAEVITLVGMQRAAECGSLPDYKKRFPKPTP